jgi:hypothetical protein
VKRLLLILGLLAGAAFPTAAQTTLVSGQVTDPNGIPYAFGRLTAGLVNANGISLTVPATVTLSSNATCQAAGLGPAPCQAPFPTSVGPFTLDSAGNLPGSGITLEDNSLVTPAGTLWRICTNTGGVPAPEGTGPQTFCVNVSVSGASQSIGATLTASAPSLSFVLGGGGIPITINFSVHNKIRWVGTNAAIYKFNTPGAAITDCLNDTSLFGCRVVAVSGNTFTTAQTDIGTSNVASPHRTIAMELQPDVKWIFKDSSGTSIAGWFLHNGSSLYGSTNGAQGGSRTGGAYLVYDCSTKSSYGISTAEGIGGVQAFAWFEHIFFEGCPSGTVGGGGSPSVAMLNWQGISSMHTIGNAQIFNFANTVGCRFASDGSASANVLGPVVITNLWCDGGPNTGAQPYLVVGSAISGVLPLSFIGGVCNHPGSGMDCFKIDFTLNPAASFGGGLISGMYMEELVNGNNTMVDMINTRNWSLHTVGMGLIAGDTAVKISQTAAGGNCNTTIQDLFINVTTPTAINNTISGFTITGKLLYPFYHYGGDATCLANTVAPLFIDSNNLDFVNGAQVQFYHSIDSTIANYSRAVFDVSTLSATFRTEHAGTGTAMGIAFNSDSGNVTILSGGANEFQFSNNQFKCLAVSCAIGASPSTAIAITGGTFLTFSNCSSSASPAVCGSAAAGSVVIAAAATTVTVNTTAVTTNSQILFVEDDSLGTKLGVTCNTTSLGATKISARVGGTSFTITTAVAPTTNPSCLSYSVVN